MATTYDQTKDPYFQGGELTPCRTAAPITKSDTVDEVSYPKQVMLLTGGTVSCIPLKNPDTGPGTATFGALLAGAVLPFRVRRVNATGTSATLIALND